MCLSLSFRNPSWKCANHFFQLPAGTGYNPVVIIFSLPHYLYCGSHSYIYKLHCETGDVIWKVPHRSNLTSIWLHESKLLVASGGYVDCLDAQTGASKWSSNLKGAGYSVTTMIVIGMEVVAACAAYLFSFDLETGKQVWHDPLKVRLLRRKMASTIRIFTVLSQCRVKDGAL